MRTETCLGLHSDRRTCPDPSVAREARYTLLSGEDIGRTGTVMITDITSGGILFATEHQLAPGQLVELSISWPALELVARGQVMHAAEGKAMFSIGQSVRSRPVKSTICELAGVYLVIWRRVGGHDTFRHRVVASSEGEAFLASRREVDQALGPNSELWELADIRRQGPADSAETKRRATEDQNQ
jgi:hypothetical protein